MITQESPPDFDVPRRREPGACPELVAEMGLITIEPMGRFATPWSGKGYGWLGLGAWSGWWARRTPLHPGAGEPVIEPGGGVDVTDEAP
jgi:hypothetical protein